MSCMKLLLFVFIALLPQCTHTRRRVMDNVIPPCGTYCHQQTIAPLHRKLKQVEGELTKGNQQVDEIGDAVEELINGAGETVFCQQFSMIEMRVV